VKVYRLLKDHKYSYKDSLGDIKEVFHSKDSLAYEGIDLGEGKRTHYFNKKAGNGGDFVDLIEVVENSPKIFKLVV